MINFCFERGKNELRKRYDQEFKLNTLQLISARSKPRSCELLKKRLNAFRDTGHINLEIDIDDFVSIINGQVFMVTLIHKIILKKKAAVSKRQFLLFAKAMVKGIQ